MSAEEIASSANDLIQFLFDSRHTFADIYSVFSAVLAFGAKNLY